MPILMTWARAIGVSMVIAGILVNKWTLELVLSSDGAITSFPVRVAIAVGQVLLIGCGLLIWRRKLPIPGIALSAVSVTGVLAVAEVVLRLSALFQPTARWYVGERANRVSRNFAPDPQTGWRMRPNHAFEWAIGGSRQTYRSNGQGMRDPDDFAAPCEKPRLVLIGDSFVFGTGVEYEQTVGAQLEDSLNGQVEAYSLAMPGFGLDQMWMSLRYQALGLCPALLVVAIIDDDWDRSLTAYREVEGMNKPTFVLDGDSLRRATTRDRPHSLARFADRHSSLWRLVRLSMRNLAFRIPVGEWWSVNVAILDSMARDAAIAGIPILFVRLPRRGEWRPFPALRAHMERIAAAYVDLADPSEARGDVHLASDDHIGPEGHAWLAGRILIWARTERPARLKPVLASTREKNGRVDVSGRPKTP